MSNWRPDFDPSHLYFVTTTAVQRAHIFRRDVIKRILVDGLYHLHVVDRAVTRPEKQQYKVWEDGYNAKDVFSPDFLLQNMEYTHNNPIQPHWRLAEHAEDYIWSSARFYLLDEPALIPLSDAQELF